MGILDAVLDVLGRSSESDERKLIEVLFNVLEICNKLYGISPHIAKTNTGSIYQELIAGYSVLDQDLKVVQRYLRKSSNLNLEEKEVLKRIEDYLRNDLNTKCLKPIIAGAEYGVKKHNGASLSSIGLLKPVPNPVKSAIAVLNPSDAAHSFFVASLKNVINAIEEFRALERVEAELMSVVLRFFKSRHNQLLKMFAAEKMNQYTVSNILIQLTKMMGDIRDNMAKYVSHPELVEYFKNEYQIVASVYGLLKSLLNNANLANVRFIEVIVEKDYGKTMLPAGLDARMVQRVYQDIITTIAHYEHYISELEKEQEDASVQTA